jgi:hypothetical protein
LKLEKWGKVEENKKNSKKVTPKIFNLCVRKKDVKKAVKEMKIAGEMF